MIVIRVVSFIPFSRALVTHFIRLSSSILRGMQRKEEEYWRQSYFPTWIIHLFVRFRIPAFPCALQNKPRRRICLSVQRLCITLTKQCHLQWWTSATFFVIHFNIFCAYPELFYLRTVPTIVIAHTFCASPDTRISYRQCLLIQGYFCVV